MILFMGSGFLVAGGKSCVRMKHICFETGTRENGTKSMTIAVAVTLSQGTFAMTGLNGGLVIQWNLVLVAAILGFFIG